MNFLLEDRTLMQYYLKEKMYNTILRMITAEDKREWTPPLFQVTLCTLLYIIIILN